MSYQNSLKEKRKAVNGPSASDVGSQRLGSKGYSSKGRSRFIDENMQINLKLVLYLEEVKRVLLYNQIV